MNSMGAHLPLVSVIIPTFNRAHIISRSIESVLCQTFTDYEIIVVDDGSTDHTGELLRKRYRDRIRYVAKSANEGLSAARNAGIALARGTYIAILDDDDLWLPEKMAGQVALAENDPGLGLVYCGSLKVSGSGEVIEEMRPYKRGNIFEDLLHRNYLLGPASVALFPRSVLSKSGLFDTSLSPCADWDLWIRIARCARIDFVDQPLVKYVIHDGNMHSNVKSMEKDTFAVLNKYWPKLEQERGCGELRNTVYSNHAIHFAWKYYEQGEEGQFKNLLSQALEWCPLNQVVMRGSGLKKREEAVMEIIRASWEQSGRAHNRRAYRERAARHYLQLAWEYYHQGSMGDFRRCVMLSWRNAFPNVPLRMVIPFAKSFMGKDTSDGIHRIRRRLTRDGIHLHWD